MNVERLTARDVARERAFRLLLRRETTRISRELTASRSSKDMARVRPAQEAADAARSAWATAYGRFTSDEINRLEALERALTDRACAVCGSSAHTSAKHHALFPERPAVAHDIEIKRPKRGRVVACRAPVPGWLMLDGGRMSKALKGKKIRSSYDTFALVREKAQAERTEAINLIGLGAGNIVLFVYEMARGDESSCQIQARDLFCQVCKNQRLLACILVHNHPSGNPNPSGCDVELTKRVKAGFLTLGMQLVDHVIVGADERYYSFADRGMI